MPSPQPRQLLIVEDDAAIRDGLERGLRMHGFTVDGVADAERALISVANRRPDMLVLDVGLPGLSGIELCERLRTFGVDVPILSISRQSQARACGGQRGNYFKIVIRSTSISGLSMNSVSTSQVNCTRVFWSICCAGMCLASISTRISAVPSEKMYFFLPIFLVM